MDVALWNNKGKPFFYKEFNEQVFFVGGFAGFEKLNCVEANDDTS